MNKSKKKDSRFELKWLLFGAIAAIWFSRTCLICNKNNGSHRLGSRRKTPKNTRCVKSLNDNLQRKLVSLN